MLNKKILLIPIIFILLISFILSSSIGNVKQGEPVELYQMCSSCTYVNLTSITYPNKTILIIGELMNGNGNDYTYEFNDTNQIDEYKYNVCGDKDGTLTCEVITFLVTPSGYTQTTSQGIGSLGYLGLMVILMFVFGLIGFRFFKTENWWVVGILFEFFALLFLIYNTYLGYQYHKIISGLPESGMPEIIFGILLFILIVGGLVSITLLILKWKKLFKYIKREMKRRDDEDKDVEDWDVDQWAGVSWNPNERK